MLLQLVRLSQLVGLVKVPPASFLISTKMHFTTSVLPQTTKDVHGVRHLSTMTLTKDGATVEVIQSFATKNYLQNVFSFLHTNQSKLWQMSMYLFCICLLTETSCDSTTSPATTIIPSTPCLTYTVAGNAKGAFCQFPFRYKGNLYYECTTIDEKQRKLWCATTANYDIDKQWGQCAGKKHGIILIF
jgi:integrin beta 3